MAMIYIQLLNWNGNLYTTLLWMKHLHGVDWATINKFNIVIFFPLLKNTIKSEQQTTICTKYCKKCLGNTLTSETCHQSRNYCYKQTDKPTQQSQYTSISFTSHIMKWQLSIEPLIFKPEKISTVLVHWP